MSALNWLTLARLESVVRVPHRQILSIAAQPHLNYHDTVIVHRGKRRTLMLPSKELKMIQRRLYQRVLKPLVSPPLSHPSAACGVQRGVVWAVRRHTAHPCLFHIDLRDFYPNVTPRRVAAAFQRLGVHPEAADAITGLVTARGQLPQGAPTSPAIGEVVLFPLDARVAGLCRRLNLVYTRYADDLAISGGCRRVRAMELPIRRVIADDGWQLSDKGGTFTSGQRRRYLKLLLQTKPNVDRTYYEAVRRAIRRAATGKLVLHGSERRSLDGKIQWIEAVNAGRGTKLRNMLNMIPIRDCPSR